MISFNSQESHLIGPSGSLPILLDDEVTLKLVMLIVGECLGLGPVDAAAAFGYTKQRYFQLLAAFSQEGASALRNQKPGPKSNYRRTDEVVRQTVRHRFLAPDASAEVIAQKLCQTGLPISTRSVVRIIEQFGLQKKTLSLQAKR
jgi:hypothetical protein